jgi:TorA maturation chaperone TorD
MVETLTLDMENARAEVYQFLGTLLTENLSPESLGNILNVKTASYVNALFPDPEVQRDFEKLIDNFSEGRLTATDIMLDFEALLRVPGPAYICPYESSYRGRKQIQGLAQWGLLNGSSTREVQRLYQNEHLSVRSELADFPDHIGAEMTFMACLCRKMAQALNTGNETIAEKLREKQKQFLQNHLLQWSKDFAKEMRSKASTLFYRCLADLLSNFLEMEEWFLRSESIN